MGRLRKPPPDSARQKHAENMRRKMRDPVFRAKLAEGRARYEAAGGSYGGAPPMPACLRADYRTLRKHGYSAKKALLMAEEYYAVRTREE